MLLIPAITVSPRLNYYSVRAMASPTRYPDLGFAIRLQKLAPTNPRMGERSTYLPRVQGKICILQKASKVEDFAKPRIYVGCTKKWGADTYLACTQGHNALDSNHTLTPPAAGLPTRGKKEWLKLLDMSKRAKLPSAN